jgi:hypothetical protein
VKQVNTANGAKPVNTAIAAKQAKQANRVNVVKPVNTAIAAKQAKQANRVNVVKPVQKVFPVPLGSLGSLAFTCEIQ